MSAKGLQRLVCAWLAAGIVVLPTGVRAARTGASPATRGAEAEEPRASDDGDLASDPPPPGADAAAEAAAEAEPGTAPEPEAQPPTDRERAAAAFREGTRFYELGQYAQAIEKFQRAWELAPEPQLLYNLGQAQWKWFDVDPDIEHLRKARTFFQNYDKRMRLREGYDSAEVDGYVRALTAQIDAEVAKAAERARPVIVEPSIAERDEAERRRLEQARKLRITRGLQISGLTLIILGGASLAMGLGGLIAHEAEKVILDNSTSGQPGTTNFSSVGEDNRRRNGYLVGGQVAFTGFILAGVFMPVGITLRVVGGVREKRTINGAVEREHAVSLRPGARLLTIRF